jgi:hypothetical protein
MLWLLPVASVGHVPLAVGSIEGVMPEPPPELEPLEPPLDPELLDPPELLELELLWPPELLPELAPLLEPDPPEPELEALPPLLPELLPLEPVAPLPPEPPDEPPLELVKGPELPGDGAPLQAGIPKPRAMRASAGIRSQPRGSCDFMGSILRQAVYPRA